MGQIKSDPNYQGLIEVSSEYLYNQETNQHNQGIQYFPVPVMAEGSDTIQYYVVYQNPNYFYQDPGNINNESNNINHNVNGNITNHEYENINQFINYSNNINIMSNEAVKDPLKVHINHITAAKYIKSQLILHESNYQDDSNSDCENNNYKNINDGDNNGSYVDMFNKECNRNDDKDKNANKEKRANKEKNCSEDNRESTGKDSKDIKEYKEYAESHNNNNYYADNIIKEITNNISNNITNSKNPQNNMEKKLNSNNNSNLNSNSKINQNLLITKDKMKAMFSVDSKETIKDKNKNNAKSIKTS